MYNVNTYKFKYIYIKHIFIYYIYENSVVILFKLYNNHRKYKSNNLEMSCK